MMMRTSSSAMYPRSSPIITISTVSSNGRRQIRTIPLILEDSGSSSNLASSHNNRSVETLLDVVESDLIEQLFRHTVPRLELEAMYEGGATGGHFGRGRTRGRTTITATHNRMAQEENSKATNEKQMAELPTIVCDPTDSYQTQFGDCNKECTVCLCDAQPSEKLMILPCQHSFHEDCLMPWLKKHNSCPTCRYELEMADPGLDRNRLTRMSNEYGEEAMKLMKVCTQVQKVYSRLQALLLAGSLEGKSTRNAKSSSSRDRKKKITILNSMESTLVTASRQLNSLKIPSAASSASGRDETSSRNMKRYTWDWNRVRQLQQQYLQRINVLLDRIDTYREQLTSGKKSQCCIIC